MTTRDHAHRASELARSGRADRLELSPAGPSLPERLAAARERKGVDLSRAERDTKIRARYLADLERGDYRDLPGTVYTKGFLRNYATYLGLDAEDVIRQWRRERGDQLAPEPLVVPPRPIAEPPRPLTFSPSILVAALMTLGVVAFGVYLAVQLLRYAKPPELTVTNPATAVLDVSDGVTSYSLEGLSTAGATIEITTAGQTQPYRTTALADGTWRVQVDLRRGKNEFQITAKNPDTAKVTDTPRTVVISVPFLVIAAPTLTVSQPVDGTTYQNGAIPLEGMTTNAKSVTVLATYLGTPGSTPAPPGPTPLPSPSARPGASPGPGSSPGASGPPAGTTVTVNDDGSFSTPLELAEGRWAITVTATAAGGQTSSLTRTVTVAYQGVSLVLEVKGGSAWIKVWLDGVLAPGYASGRTVHPGETLTFNAKSTIEVRTGSSGSTYFTLNGKDLGTLGRYGVPETWLFQPPHAPTLTNRR
ncbi:MAG TPA: helix-turn-helix domain-containing protein [Candidatus Limnocylindrales bacterium]|jgi:cytoskeletal protein RodZ